MIGARSPVGVRLIIAYKFAKAVGQAVLAGVIIFMLRGDGAEHLHRLAEVLREHVVHTWSIAAADLLVTASAPRHVALGAVVLALDSVVSAFEGWALHVGRWWAPWVVVVATGSLIPFEVYEVFRHLHVSRVAVLLINVAIVIYLARRVRRERLTRKAATQA